MLSSTRGALYGALAYFLWGLAPLYWPLLLPATPVEILAQRIVWSLVVMLVILTLWRHWSRMRSVLRNPRQMLFLTVGALLISANWGLFIYTVQSGNTLQASLGYFINPLVSVALGVLVFAERLRRAQWAAVCLAVAAVAVLTIDYGAPPWLALGMAFSFAGYGLVKKFVRLDGVESLSMETALIFLPALGYLALLHAAGTGTFGTVSPSHTLLLAGAGLVTALPLLAFGAAAYRIPLTVLGLLQFIAPVMHFLIAWLIFAEELTTARWAGFAIVWSALALFIADLLRNAREARLRAAAEPAVG